MLTSHVSNASSRQLEMLATEFLAQCGCTEDGARVEEIDPRQSTFEDRVFYSSKGDHYTWY